MRAWPFWGVQILRVLLIAAAVAAGRPWPTFVACWLLLVLLRVELREARLLSEGRLAAAIRPATAPPAVTTISSQRNRSTAAQPHVPQSWFVPDTSRRQH